MPRPIHSSRPLSTESIDDGYLADSEPPPKANDLDEDVFESWDVQARKAAYREFVQNDPVRLVSLFEQHGISAISSRGSRVVPPASYLREVYEKALADKKPVYAIFYMNADVVVSGTMTTSHAVWLDEIRKARPLRDKPSSSSLGAASLTYDSQLSYLLKNMTKI